tara:strand:+ start:156 stop:311 length:156 start_codon:yes stop_codon:yes gene_type:complete
MKKTIDINPFTPASYSAGVGISEAKKKKINDKFNELRKQKLSTKINLVNDK